MQQFEFLHFLPEVLIDLNHPGIEKTNEGKDRQHNRDVENVEELVEEHEHTLMKSLVPSQSLGSVQLLDTRGDLVEPKHLVDVSHLVVGSGRSPGQLDLFGSSSIDGSSISTLSCLCRFNAF